MVSLHALQSQNNLGGASIDLKDQVMLTQA